MQRKNLIAVSFGALLVAGTLFAAAWDKPFEQWSQSDMAKVMLSSPWGGQEKVKGVEGTGVVQGSNVVKVYWQTAMPIKQVLFGPPAARGDNTARALLNKIETVHVLRVENLPSNLRDFASETEFIIRNTMLAVLEGPEIHPIDIQIPGRGASNKAKAKGGNNGTFGATPPAGVNGSGKNGETLDLYYIFDEKAPITAEVKEFEFRTTIGKVSISKKFKPKEMVYHGRLEW